MPLMGSLLMEHGLHEMVHYSGILPYMAWYSQNELHQLQKKCVSGERVLTITLATKPR